MPELSDNDFAAAQRAVQILQQLSTNPESRADFERSLKKLDPKIRTREDEANELTAPLREQIEAMQKAMADREERDAKAIEDRLSNEAMAKLNEGFARLRAQGVQPEGEEVIKKIMVDRNIPDPEAAFALFERNNPKPSSDAASYTPDYWNYEKDSVVDNKLLFANPDKWEDETIGQVLMEERRKGGGDY